MIMCPACSHVAYHDHFVLYQDPDAELIAYVYPPAQQKDAEALRQMMMKGFNEAQIVYEPKDRKLYQPLLMFGLTTLVEMLHTEEDREEQAEIADAISKERKISIVRLHRAKARTLSVPSVLPISEMDKNPARETILAGISLLLDINPALSVYADLHKRIQADPNWALMQ